MGLGCSVWCIHSKRFWGMGLQDAHPCVRCEKGKPAARRGAKPMGL
jgi:hypothetical protein